MKSIHLILSVSLIYLLVSCGHQENHHHGLESTFQVSSPYNSDTSVLKSYVCQIHSFRHIELRSQEKGYLTGVFVDEGDFVKEGALLFQIMPSLYEAEVKKAEAEAKLAEIEYENTKLLSDSNVVSINELAMAEAKLDKAKAELDLARVHLGFTQVRAPFDGYIDRFRVRPGSLVDEGEWLTSMSDNSKMWVYFNVPEAEYLEYQSQMIKADSSLPIDLLMANQKLFPYQGVIETIEADFNNETGNIPFRATFPNPNGLLRHGETGNVLIKEPVSNALIIPQKSTYEVLDKKFVFVVGEDSVIRPRSIKIAYELPHLFIVKDGLNKDDKILIEGLRKVKKGQKINYHFIAPEKSVSNLELYAE